GVSGSGKTLIGSRFARALGVEFVEGDSYHPPENIKKMIAGVPLNDVDRETWLHAIGERVHLANDTGVGVVVSCSALKRSYRDKIRREAGGVRFVFLRGERELIAGRIKERKDHFMPLSLLDSQFSTLEEPAPDEDVWVIDIKHSPEEIVEELVARASRER
ncbi:MAG TPA: gluconokinase, partial [Gemmatimonadaceae bacterium]|nr:gluconokinase [Gemmatimonadaceae bacterium]